MSSAAHPKPDPKPLSDREAAALIARCVASKKPPSFAMQARLTATGTDPRWCTIATAAHRGWEAVDSELLEIPSGEVERFRMAIAAAKAKADAAVVDQNIHSMSMYRPKHFNLTDLGNTERLVARFGEDLRFCNPWRTWLYWDGFRWAKDETGAAMRMAQKVARGIYKEALNSDDEGFRKNGIAWGLKSEAQARIAALLKLAESKEDSMQLLPKCMDQNPWLLNAANGTINLKTGELQPHNRGDYLTQLAPTPFDPKAECPLWESTLRLFFAENQALIDYFNRLAGYSLCGLVRDHILPVCYGFGSNGKSTMLGTLLNVLGPEYAMKAPHDMLMAKRGDSHPTDVAGLFGKRLVVAIESEAGKRLNESLIKELTGGDIVTARRMREDFWSFTPTHTLMMATNHRPVIRGTDDGIWRRLRLVPFTVQVDGSKADATVPERLKAEHAGILAWMVRGCLAWQSEGLDAPTEVELATAAYKAEMDTLGTFIGECCTVLPSLKSKADDLYTCYKQWCDKAGENAENQRKFGTAMTERKFRRYKNVVTWYEGIGIRDTSEGRDWY